MPRNRDNLLIFFLFCTVSFVLMSSQQFRPSHDDVWFPANFKKAEGLLDWLTHRYTTWSGRVAIEATLPYVLGTSVWLWKSLNTLFIIILFTSLQHLAQAGKRCTDTGKKWFISLCTLVFILNIQGRVLDEGAFWATGSMNYLWPAACLCLVLLLYVQLISGRNPAPSLWAGAIIPATFAAYQEQTGLIMITFGAFALALYRLRENRWPRLGISLGLVALVHFSILVFAPGNAQRLCEEIARFYPGFNDLGLVGKLISGLNYTLLNHYCYDFAKPTLLLLLITLFLAVRRKGPMVLRWLLAFALTYTLVGLIVAKSAGGEYAHLFNYNIYGGDTAQTGVLSSPLNAVPLVLGSVVLFVLPPAWLILFRSTPACLVLCLFYLAGLSSSFVLSLSPTIYASGYRIFFVPDVMVVAATLVLCRELVQQLDMRGRLLLPVSGLLIINIVVRTVDIASG